MTKESKSAAQTNDEHAPSKRELEQQMQKTRESLAETVGEIKETVEQEYKAVRQTVSGVLDYREQFEKEPLVWSLGALSAGFALGYTVGYAHKNTKGGKQSPLMAFADGMVEELSTVGKGLVMPALSAKIKELFGFDFAEVINDLGTKRSGRKKSSGKRKSLKTGTRKRAQKKKAQ